MRRNQKGFICYASRQITGPDGFTCEFFKSTWSVIGKGFIPKSINSTILSLIPMKEEARQMKDYRPISCCNVLYKIISKILTNRLKKLLPKFISSNQSSFFKDQLLMENVLMASESVKCYHKSSVSSRCAVKIDISKAYDSVQGSFLLSLLTAIGVPDKLVVWIKKCIELSSFSVQANGELDGYFGSERGLRKGCFLSLCFFVICMKVLTKMMDIAAMNKNLGYHPYCQGLNLTHICFVDDLLVFFGWKE